MNNDKAVREQLILMLCGGKAHVTFEQAIANFPIKHANSKAPNISYTPWQLLEHLRIAQWDILEFIRVPNFKSPKWPEGYWPSANEQADHTKWQKTIKQFRDDLSVLAQLVEDSNTDLYSPIPHAKDYTILQEVMLLADHNSYHLGQLVVLRKMLQCWS